LSVRHRRKDRVVPRLALPVRLLAVLPVGVVAAALAVVAAVHPLFRQVP